MKKNREKVGVVSEMEKKTILALYERKHGISELKETVGASFLNDEERTRLLEKIRCDEQTTNNRYDQWWQEKPLKYNWKMHDDGEWVLDFETNEIFLEYA